MVTSYNAFQFLGSILGSVLPIENYDQAALSTWHPTAFEFQRQKSPIGSLI